MEVQATLEGHLDGIGWVPRHFRLSDSDLEFYSPNELQNPTGIIPLLNVRDVTSLSTGSGRELSVRAPGRNYLLRAPTAAAAQKWLEAINEAVKNLRDANSGSRTPFKKVMEIANMMSSRNEIISSSFENLEMDPGKKDYIDENRLKNHLSHVLLACADSKPRDPLHWMSEYLKKLSLEEEEDEIDPDKDAVRYKESWRWYIYTAERKIDLWKEMMRPANPANVPKEPPIPREDLFKFTCFLPNIILKQIDEGRIKNNVDVQTIGASRPLNPICAQLDAVVVFCDASGFTNLTEKLSRQPNGAEELGRFLNVFFCKLINIVSFFGGDIIKFSGDAVTIMWPATKGDPDFDPRDMVYKSAKCSLHVHKALTDYETPVEGVNFSFHIGVGFGMVTVMQVGGIFDRWEYCISGPPLEQIAIAEPLAKSGQTCFSPQAAELLYIACDYLGINLEVLPQTSVPGFVLLPPKIDIIPRLTKKSDMKAFVGEKFEASMLKKYIPGAMYRALSSGSHFEEEMRRVTVVFLSIEGLDTSTEEGATMAQLLMICCQRSVYALEGSINKFLVDDKGILLLALFGLPPLSHFGDDPVRATLAAMRMIDSLKAEDVGGKVGVATGIVWCGVVGSDNRREYTVLGDVVNLSARLMGKAATVPGNILVDKITYEVLLKHDFEVHVMTPVVMKGKSQPVPVFCPTGRVFYKDPNRVGPKESKTKLGMIRSNQKTFWTEGREVELMRRCMLNQLNDEGGGIVVVSGPPGAGKTHLLKTITMLQMTEKFTLLEGNNLSPTSTHSVPFLCWQRIFTKLGYTIQQDPELVAELSGGSSSYSGGVSMKSLVSSMLNAEMESWVPLLSKVMTNLEFGDTLVKAMTDADLRHQKKNQLRSICMDVLEWYSSRRPTVVLLHLKHSTSFNEEEDKRAYPFARGIADLIIKNKRKELASKNAAAKKAAEEDPPSCAVGPRGVPKKPCLIFILVCRDNAKEMQNPTFTWLRDVARESGSYIEMKLFSRKETGKYLAYRYGYTATRPLFLPEQIICHVHEMTQGNAALIDRIAEQLIEEGIVDVNANGDITWYPSDEGELDARLNSLQPPMSIVSIAFSHFDRLAPSQQHIIKIATALIQDERHQSSDNFTSDQIGRATGKMDEDNIRDIRAELNQLVKDEILMMVEKDTYRFKSKFWKIAAEKLTLQSQKWRVQR